MDSKKWKNFLTEGKKLLSETKCIAYLRTGKYETDELIIKFPTGVSKRVWLHTPAFDELNPQETKLYLSVLDKVVDAVKERNDWEKENKPDGSAFKTQQWKKLFPPGLGNVYVDLTYPEMEVIKKLADWKQKI